MAAERAGRAGAERRHAACLRAQQATSADELRALAAHPSWRVRRCVAWNERSSRETVASLLRDPHHRVRAVAVHRPQVLGDDLHVLAGERHPTVLTLLVGRIDAPTPLLAALVADPAVGAAIAEVLAVRPRPDVLVVLTDAETPWPSGPVGVPVIVGVTRRGADVPSWVTTVHIERPRIPSLGS